MAGKRKAAPARSAAHNADFKKIKRKVGKKVLQKANVTNTSFATKSIHVPTQKLASADNTAHSLHASHSSSALTNARSHNLHDLFTHCKHYSSNVRRDAMGGLKDLLEKHPAILQLEAAPLLHMVMPALLDEEKSVRTALMGLLNHILPLLAASGGLHPFYSMQVSYICSAMSHMHFAIRRGGLQVLSMLMEAANKHDEAGGRALWHLSFKQLLPNFISCMQERIYVAKQSHQSTTELVLPAASAGGSGPTGRFRGTQGGAGGMDQGGAGGGASTSASLANRASMLQCMGQFLALCPYGQEGKEGGEQRATSLSAAQVHSSALHSLIFPDASTSTGGSGSGSASSASASTSSLDPWSTLSSLPDGASSLQQGAARPLPMKYARKMSQQTKFFNTAPAATEGANTSSSATTSLVADKNAAGRVLTTFIQELLPLCMEYWLESFGLAQGGSSSSGHVGGATPLKGKDQSELLSNLLALMKLIKCSLDIMRRQRREMRAARIIEMGGVVGEEDEEAADPFASEADLLSLPTTFPGSLRAHVFTHFPFSPSVLSPVLTVDACSDQQIKGLNTLNALCVDIMSCFLRRKGQETEAEQANKQKNNMSKAAAARMAKLEEADAEWLERILAYMADSFQSLTQHSIARAEAQAQAQAQAQVEQEEERMQDAEEQEEEEEVAPKGGRGQSQPKQKGGKRGSAASCMMQLGSLSDLLPLLQTLLPRLSVDKQVWMVDAFLNFYLSCPPLSASKLSCLRFLHSYLLSPSPSVDGERMGERWFRLHPVLRQVFIERGEWSALMMAVSQAMQREQVNQKRRVEEAVMKQQQAPSSLFAAASTSASTPSPASSPLLVRYADMMELLVALFLNSARFFHGRVLDYNMIQPQIIPFFGVLAPQEEEAAAVVNGGVAPVHVQPGPFWTLPLHLQHQSLQLLYYFDFLAPPLLQVLLECLRNNLAQDSTSSPLPLLPLQSRILVLDLLEEKHALDSAKGAWSLQSYLSFLLGLLRSDLQLGTNQRASAPQVISPSKVSDLLPTVCRMLRGISTEEIDQAAAAAIQPHQQQQRAGAPIAPLSMTSSSPSALLELLAPILAQCLQAAQSATTITPPKLDLLSSLLLLDALWSHAGPTATLPSVFPPLLSPTFLHLLSSTLTGSQVEGGAIQMPVASSTPLVRLVREGKIWRVAMQMLVDLEPNSQRQTHPSIFGQVLQLMQQRIDANTAASIQSGERDSAMQVVVVLAALVKCDGMRDLLRRHSASILRLAASIRSHPAGQLASNTLLASLQSDLTMIFGRQAEQS